MESNSDAWGNASDERALLDAIVSDRSRMAARVTAETWWTAPAQGIGAALLVGAPAAGWQWGWILLAASIGIFGVVELYFRKRSGLTISLPAGAGGWLVLIALAFITVAALVVSFILALVGATVWVLLVALLAGVLWAFGVVIYDRTYAAEVRSAR